MHDDFCIKKWSNEFGPELNEAKLKDKYWPSDKYRISTNNYPANTNTGGTMRRGKCFVLCGKLQLTICNHNTILSQGECCNFPAGEFNFKSLSVEAIEIIFVWEISQ